MPKYVPPIEPSVALDFLCGWQNSCYLQKRKVGIILVHCRIFGPCLAQWFESDGRDTQIIYISKPAKDCYFEPKSLSLMSFPPKTIEKLFNKYLSKVILAMLRLPAFHRAYQPGKSCDSALCLTKNLTKKL